MYDESYTSEPYGNFMHDNMRNRMTFPFRYSEEGLRHQANPIPFPGVQRFETGPAQGSPMPVGALPSPTPASTQGSMAPGPAQDPLTVDPMIMLFICFVLIILLLGAVLKQASDIKLLLSLLVKNSPGAMPST
jgi:hypothetical protein